MGTEATEPKASQTEAWESPCKVGMSWYGA